MANSFFNLDVIIGLHKCLVDSYVYLVKYLKINNEGVLSE